MMKEPTVLKKEVRHVSIEEGLKAIQADQDNLLDLHKGFLCEGDLPFRPPQVTEDGIVFWPPVDIHPGAVIGHGVMIGRYTNILGDVTIGEYSRLQGFNFIPDCVEIGKKVFVGPGVIFTNVKRPKIRDDQMKHRDGKIIIEDFASIGAGVILCPGVKIGSGAMIGAGAVVTKDVPAGKTVIGCPAVNMRLERGE